MAQDIMDLTGVPTKHRNPVKTLVLKVIDGTKPLSSTGIVDKDLFSGENELYALMDEENLLWSFKYKRGILPPALKEQKFTSFKNLKTFADHYFKTRNIEIVEVKD